MKLEDFKKAKIEAMKAKDADTISALNVVINKTMLATIEKRAKGEELAEADIIAIVQKAERELIEERDAFANAGRTENVASLNNQIAAVGKYLPKLMSAEEIRAEILKLEDKSVPAVMRHFKTNFAGKCDMRTVSEILKSL